MGFKYEGGRGAASLFEEAPIERCARRIVERVGEYLKDRVKFHTPVGEPAPGVSVSDFIEERGGRRPGTLRDSWEGGEVVVAEAGRFSITVSTDDPVAPYVENPTRPHTIRGKGGGILRFRDRETGRVVYATEVHHPGTEGSYMLAKALQETAIRWQVIAREELDRLAAGGFG